MTRSSGGAAPPSRGAGRPRDPRIERDALQAVRDLLVEEGYAAVTVGAVAERARTTKAALYRRWPSLPHLVHEAAFPRDLTHGMSFGADLRTDLRTVVTGTCRAFSTPVAAAALPGLLAEMSGDPAIDAASRARFLQVYVELDDRLRQGAAAGEVRGEACAEDVLRLVTGAVLIGVLLGTEDLDDHWVDRLVDLLVRGLRP